jgi:hypothetical protein
MQAWNALSENIPKIYLTVNKGGHSAISNDAELQVFVCLLILMLTLVQIRMEANTIPDVVEVKAGIDGLAGPPVVAAIRAVDDEPQRSSRLIWQVWAK